MREREIDIYIYIERERESDRDREREGQGERESSPFLLATRRHAPGNATATFHATSSTPKTMNTCVSEPTNERERENTFSLTRQEMRAAFHAASPIPQTMNTYANEPNKKERERERERERVMSI